MKRFYDIMAVLSVAAVTATVVVGTLAPNNVSAKGEQSITPPVALNQLTVDGCTFTLHKGKELQALGAQPVQNNIAEPAALTVEVEMNNPTDKPVDTTIWVTMKSQPMASMLSRRAVMPSPVWSKPCVAKLAPGESKTVTLETGVAVGKKQIVNFEMSTKKPVVNSLQSILQAQTQNQVQVAPTLTLPQSVGK